MSPPPDADYSWIVEQRVARVGRVITLRRNFTDMVIKRFPAGALGSLFFRTPAEAVRHFAAQGRAKIEAARRSEREANAMLSWAMDWAIKHTKQQPEAEVMP